jgi:serine/threonine protein kinase
MAGSDDWDKLETIFNDALNKQGHERQSFVEQACGDNTELLEEVNDLLSAHQNVDKGKWLEGSSVPRTLSQGDYIDNYRVLRMLSRGATGEVYLVTDDRTGAKYAVKCLPLIYSSDEEILARFKKEAELTTPLKHVNINRMYGFFTSEDNLHYLLMDYSAGKTLSEVLEGYRLTVAQSFHIFEQVCRALKCAHDLGIWHRDVKPSNIMLEGSTVKVIDFGIARDASSVLTATGVRLGSPAYMSPEQWIGKSVDQRTDIWALGVLLYEMLTGELPFNGVNYYAIQQSIVKDKPTPVSSLNSETNMYFDLFIDQMLSKSVEYRLGSIDELLIKMDILKRSIKIKP